MGHGEGQKLSAMSSRLGTPQGWRSAAEEMMPTGRYGFGANTDKAVEGYGDMMFGKQSANFAARGMNAPENMSGVIGSAISNSLPYLIPQMQNFQAMQFMAPQNLMNTAKASADYWNRALGAQSDSSASAFGFNFSGGGGATPSGG
jgi:hypothetical protein